MGYKFRIRFFLPRHFAFSGDLPLREISFGDGRPIYVMQASREDLPIEKSDELIISGGWFDTIDEANAAGARAQEALALSASVHGVGISFGFERGRGGLSDHAIRKILDECGIRVVNAEYGVQVWDDSLPTKFIAMEGNVAVVKDSDSFVDCFQKIVSKNIPTSEKVKTALDIYGASHFETSFRTRFLLLVVVVEVLSPPQRRDSESVRHVDRLIDLTRNSGLANNAIESMVGSLKWLKDNSISSSCRDVVDLHLPDRIYGGKSASKFFSECYQIRSKIVHEGGQEVDLEGLKSKTLLLDELVCDLFKAIFSLEI